MTEPKTLAEQVVVQSAGRNLGGMALGFIERGALAAIEARDKEWRAEIERRIEYAQQESQRDDQTGGYTAMNAIAVRTLKSLLAGI